MTEIKNFRKVYMGEGTIHLLYWRIRSNDIHIRNRRGMCLVAVNDNRGYYVALTRIEDKWVSGRYRHGEDAYLYDLDSLVPSAKLFKLTDDELVTHFISEVI